MVPQRQASEEETRVRQGPWRAGAASGNARPLLNIRLGSHPRVSLGRVSLPRVAPFQPLRTSDVPRLASALRASGSGTAGDVLRAGRGLGAEGLFPKLPGGEVPVGRVWRGTAFRSSGNRLPGAGRRLLGPATAASVLRRVTRVMSSRCSVAQ